MNSLPTTRRAVSRPVCLAVSIAIWACASTAQAATVVSFFDGTFDPGDWITVVTSLPDGATFSANQVPGGGLPGENKWIGLETGRQPGGGAQYNFRLFLYSPGLTWDPAADGAIEKLDFEWDSRVITSTLAGSGGVFLRPAIRQDGLLYVAITDVPAQPTSTVWTRFTYETVPENWISPGGVGPDFSSTGSPMEFGLRAAISLTCNATGVSGCRSETVVTALDNYSLTLTVVPVPAAVWLLGSALLGLAGLRRLSRGLRGSSLA